jgi:hypothetical protein
VQQEDLLTFEPAITNFKSIFFPHERDRCTVNLTV